MKKRSRQQVDLNLTYRFHPKDDRQPKVSQDCKNRGVVQKRKQHVREYIYLLKMGKKPKKVKNKQVKRGRKKKIQPEQNQQSFEEQQRYPKMFPVFMEKILGMVNLILHEKIERMLHEQYFNEQLNKKHLKAVNNYRKTKKKPLYTCKYCFRQFPTSQGHAGHIKKHKKKQEKEEQKKEEEKGNLAGVGQEETGKDHISVDEGDKV